MVEFDLIDQLALLKKFFLCQQTTHWKRAIKLISSYSLFQTQLFVGGTVHEFSFFMSHRSFSKCQHLRKTVVAGILSTDRRQQTNFSFAASFWGICLLSAFILLRRLKLASVSIFHSYRPQKFLTSRHARMYRVVLYISNTLRKLMIWA